MKNIFHHQLYHRRNISGLGQTSSALSCETSLYHKEI